MKQKIKFITSGGEVTRYHTVRTIQTETVGHHSFGVAMYCYLLTGGEPSADLLMAALTHDLAEHIVGDCPAPAKRELGIGEAVNDLEAKLLVDNGFDVLVFPAEKRVLKLADIFQGMSFCIRELQLGNQNIREIFLRYKSYAEEKVLVGIERELFNTLMDMYYECK